MAALERIQQAHRAGGTLNLGISANTAATSDSIGGGQKAKTASGSVRWRLQRRAQHLLHFERVAHCQRSLSGEVVSVRRTADRAHFAGLVTCGSVWHCPICAAKVTEQRRAELQAAINSAALQGLEVYLVTYTHRHHAGMAVADQVRDLSTALSRLKARRAYKNAMTSAGALGAVRSLEVTFGDENGWHPHVHELVFAAKGQLDTLGEIRAEWAKVHKAVFGTTVTEAGFDVQNGDYAAEYVAKFGHEPEQKGWGAAEELTKGHTKATRRLAGRTPFGLLADFDKGDKRAGRLFQEYAQAFKGRRQLFWSRTLRDSLGLGEEVDDETLAAAEAPEVEDVITIVPDDWHAVVRNDARYQVLRAAERGGRAAVEELLARLRRHKGGHRGVFSVPNHFGRGSWSYDGFPQGQLS